MLYLEKEPFTGAPAPSDESVAAAGFVVPDVMQFDPRDHGVKLMTAQRATFPDAVGGFVQLSRVTREGISSRVIHRWE